MSDAAGDKTSTAPAVRSPFCGRKAVTSKSVESADTSLRRAVLARLIADPLVSTGHIGVTAIAGRVTLSGYVTSNAQKDAASAATRRVRGVERVANEVRVAVPYPAVADPPAEDLEPRPPIAAPRRFGAFNTMHLNEVGVSRQNSDRTGFAGHAR
jgi:hypothetical protein